MKKLIPVAATLFILFDRSISKCLGYVSDFKRKLLAKKETTLFGTRASWVTLINAPRKTIHDITGAQNEHEDNFQPAYYQNILNPDNDVWYHVGHSLMKFTIKNVWV